MTLDLTLAFAGWTVLVRCDVIALALAYAAVTWAAVPYAVRPAIDWLTD